MIMSNKVYDFWAPWCGPCKQIKPIIEELKNEIGFELVEINVDEDDEDISTQFKVRNIPTIIIVDEDMKEVSRQVGSVSKNALEKFLKESL